MALLRSGKCLGWIACVVATALWAVPIGDASPARVTDPWLQGRYMWNRAKDAKHVRQTPLTDGGKAELLGSQFREECALLIADMGNEFPVMNSAVPSGHDLPYEKEYPANVASLICHREFCRRAIYIHARAGRHTR
jgi:hypothetical protein